MKMKHTLLVAFLALCVAHPVLGQAEKIALYADAAGTDCSITDAAPGVIEVHMIHVGSAGSTVVSFRAPKPACWTGAVWLGDILTPPFLAIGSSQGNFWDVAYASCFVSPIYIGKMNFFGTGTGNPCCEYPVLPSISYSTVVSGDCQIPFANLVAIGAGKVTINETEDCLCNPPLAVDETTWGRVKALYR